MKVEPTDELQEAIEIETQSTPGHSVVWLHGLGADGNDFVPIVQQLALPDFGIRFIFPHAPMMPVTINGGLVMRAWYDILSASLTPGQEGKPRPEDEPGMRGSENVIRQFLDREIARGIPASRIILAGFSQGGAMALHTGLRYPHKLAGVMALSAYLPLASKLSQERDPENQHTSIFMGHGSIDNVVPMSLATRSQAHLAQLGYNVEWHDYPMMHEVCREELADIGSWMTKVLL